jgi:hypothetical protein
MSHSNENTHDYEESSASLTASDFDILNSDTFVELLQ